MAARSLIAGACHITQPALSAQIRQLEQLVGLQLFERDNRRVLVTGAGEELVTRARHALAEIQEFVEAARVFKEPLAGTLRIGVIPTVAPYVLPKALPPIRRRFPKLRLLIREETTSRLVDLAQRGQLDLLLLALEADLGELATRPLYRDRFLLVVPAGHSLANKRSAREQGLTCEELLLLEDEHCLREQALSICNAAGAQEVGDFRASTLNTLIQMVASGVGVTLLPAMAVDCEVRARDKLALVPLVKRAPGRTIGLAWRRTTARAEEFELLAELFLASAPAPVEPIGPGFFTRLKAGGQHSPREALPRVDVSNV